jgi:MoaA/NifB/PqqE/SkfB family radical SAM enzyme
VQPIIIPPHYNYIAVFLTLACNLSCSYCINRFDAFRHARGHLTGEEWVRGLNRIVSRDDLPVTLGGGEPSLHPDFSAIINGIRPELSIDLLTNLEFDIDRFMAEVPPARLRRDAPYASIRVSYHPEVMPLAPLIKKVLRLQATGYSIGIWGVLHPAQEVEVLRARDICRSEGIDFRTKEFLGEFNGKLYGRFRYPGACAQQSRTTVHCRTTEMLIGPDGAIYRCHSDLYAARGAIGHILGTEFEIDGCYRPCDQFGYCNPCDVKVKTDRFQQFGHTSVEIIDLDDTSCPTVIG